MVLLRFFRVLRGSGEVPPTACPSFQEKCRPASVDWESYWTKSRSPRIVMTTLQGASLLLQDAISSVHSAGSKPQSPKTGRHGSRRKSAFLTQTQQGDDLSQKEQNWKVSSSGEQKHNGQGKNSHKAKGAGGRQGSRQQRLSHVSTE